MLLCNDFGKGLESLGYIMLNYIYMRLRYTKCVCLKITFHFHFLFSFILNKCMFAGKVKLSSQQAVEAYRVVEC
jgi:hypothetical protein